MAMKRSNRIVLVLMGLVALVMPLATVSTSAQAATGYQGYAVYRDGVFYGANWHAAIMDDPYFNTTSWPVIMAPGSGSNVQWATWSAFLGGNKIKGYYRPNVAPTSGARDNFKYMARRLKDDAIPYSLWLGVDYNVGTAGTWVDPSEIIGMRCDGVVEYVFEWYGFRVVGSDTTWDVTRAGSSNKDGHSLRWTDPAYQAAHLTKVG
jgi:hypothetical protein